MAKENESKEYVAQLKEQVALLEKQKEILFDALDIISSCYNRQNINTLREAMKALKKVESKAISAMGQVVDLNPSRP